MVIGRADVPRLRLKPPDEDGTLRQLSVGPASGSRCIHFALAHRELPGAVFRDPGGTFDRLRGEEAGEILAWCWRRAAARCWDFTRPPPIRLTASASGTAARPVVTIRNGCVSGLRCVLVEMPAPVSPPEVHFVLVLERHGIGPSERGGEPAPGELRYLTLEAAARGPLRTFLCEWTRRGDHLNLGEGSRPEVERFLKEVGRRLGDEAAACGREAPGGGDLEDPPRRVRLPGVLTLEGLTAGDLLDDLAASGRDLETARFAYYADPERMIGRPWQVEALCAFGADICPVLESSLADEARRPWAILVLGLLGPAAAARQHALLPFLDDPLPLIRALALEAVSQSGTLPPVAVTKVGERLEDGDARVRRSAIRALDVLDTLPPELAVALEARLRDEDDLCRRLAARVTERLKPPSP